VCTQIAEQKTELHDEERMISGRIVGRMTSRTTPTFDWKHCDESRKITTKMFDTSCFITEYVIKNGKLNTLGTINILNY
jgi:hypothetical protein